MGSSLLSEEQSERRQKEEEAEGDIQQLQTAVSLCSVVSGCFPAEQQTAVEISKSCWGFFFFFFRERGAIAGSMCATSRVANITSPPAQELWRCGKVFGGDESI